MLTSYGLDGFAHAAEALTGHAVGRGRWQEFAQAVRGATRFSLLTAGIAALAFALGGHWLIALLTGLPDVRANAGEYLLGGGHAVDCGMELLAGRRVHRRHGNP